MPVFMEVMQPHFLSHLANVVESDASFDSEIDALYFRYQRCFIRAIGRGDAKREPVRSAAH